MSIIKILRVLVLGVILSLIGITATCADTLGELLPFLTGVPDHKVVNFPDTFPRSPLDLFDEEYLPVSCVENSKLQKRSWTLDRATLCLTKEDLLRVRETGKGDARWENHRFVSSFDLSGTTDTSLCKARLSLWKNSPSFMISEPQYIRFDGDNRFGDNIDLALAMDRGKNRLGIGLKRTKQSDHGQIEYRWYSSNDLVINQFLYDPMNDFFGNVFRVFPGEEVVRYSLGSEHDINENSSVRVLWSKQDGDGSYTSHYYNDTNDRDEKLDLPGFYSRQVKGLRFYWRKQQRVRPHLLYIRSDATTKIRFLPVDVDPVTDIVDYGYLSMAGKGDLWGGGIELDTGKRTNWWGSIAKSSFHYRIDLQLTTPVLGHSIVPIFHRAWAEADIEIPVYVFQLGVQKRASSRLSYMANLDYFTGDYTGDARGETNYAAGLINDEFLEDSDSLDDFEIFILKLQTCYQLKRNVTIAVGFTQYIPDFPSLSKDSSAGGSAGGLSSQTGGRDTKGGRVLDLVVTYYF